LGLCGEALESENKASQFQTESLQARPRDGLKKNQLLHLHGIRGHPCHPGTLARMEEKKTWI